MPSAPLRLLLLLAGLSSPFALEAQLSVTTPPAGSDVIGSCYHPSTWDNIRGQRRLTTPLLNITFVTDSGFRPSVRGVAMDPSLPASLRLTGLRAADFQEIADAVHDAFVAELKAQGFNVLDYDPLAVNPGFQELAHQAERSGREEAVPDAYQAMALVSGARQTMTFVGHRCPWIKSFMLSNYLPASRITRELNATLPIVSFLVEFVAYSSGPASTYDWHEFLPPGGGVGVPALRARPQLYLSAATAAFLNPDGQSATLTLTTPLGYPHAFVTNLVRTRGRNRAERKGGSYEVVVDPAAYKAGVIELLQAQVVQIARKLAAADAD